MQAAGEQTIADFVGQVAVRQRLNTPLPVLLEGARRGGRGERLLLAFSRAPVQRIPDRLTDPRIEQLAGGEYALQAAEGEWLIEPSRCFLHRDVGQQFFRVLPPVSVPWKKRLLWRLLLIAARLKV